MPDTHQILKGDSFKDHRGMLAFCNDFSLEPIVRFYEITPKDTNIIRAWQAHKKESKWFYCTQGEFEVKLVKVDSFEKPSEDLTVFTHELKADEPEILFIPGGYANGFKALKNNSKLMVFSNFDVTASKDDDFRFELNTWKTNW